MTVRSKATVSSLQSERSSDAAAVLEDFTTAWEQGRAPVVEDYLERLDGSDSQAAVDLIYREYCLAEGDGRKHDVCQFLSRFPRHKTSLERLIQLHQECPPSLLDRWMHTIPDLDALPEAGDEIGPYVLRRELGRGGFARVFLAEQTDLDDRLVVLKVSTTMTREPWLLARVRHPHIVEILSHARADNDAFQLICMPFWGGATLSAVVGARRAKGTSPRSGLDLLADLDSVAAPEFPTIKSARSARELIAGLSYSQAIGWLGARLAEALDHAFTRDVAHGDIKPSNILLSADGNPLLLDFNLAREQLAADPGGSIVDWGGTLAYMAPERLHRLALGESSWDDSASTSTSRTRSGPPGAGDSDSAGARAPGRDDRWCGPHQADIYALGVVLVEALTGRPLAPVADSTDPAQGIDFVRLKSKASGYVVARSKDAKSVLREAEAGGWKAIPPGLRAILAKCLDVNPERRYRRGLELAEDLDRWRAGRPLLRATEPFLGSTVPRWLKRRRAPILIAALSLTLILATTAVALVKSQGTLRALSLHKLGRLWDDPESRTHRFQKPSSLRLIHADDAHIETAMRALKEYDVLGPDDWRRREDVQALPRLERDDLEVWLLEQVYVYCRALAERPQSPKDWTRALAFMNRVEGPARISAFTPLRRFLNSQLGNKTANSPSAPPIRAGSLAVPWFDEYLRGVVAECELETDEDAMGEAGLPDHFEIIATGPTPDNRDGATVKAAKRALGHYNKFLVARPDSYWGHFRAAALCYGLGGRENYATAAKHLAQCLKRRPNNPMLRSHLAASLTVLQRHQEARQEIDIAIDKAPDLAELYRTRARLRTNLKETAGLREDLGHFELLRNVLPRAPWFAAIFPYPSPFAPQVGHGGINFERSPAEVDPEELVDRADLASALRLAGEPELAKVELGKILALDAGQISVRLTRAYQALLAKRYDEAFTDFETVIKDPRLLEYARNDLSRIAQSTQQQHASLITVLQGASHQFCSAGRSKEAKQIAWCGVELAIALKQPKGECHFAVARACAKSRPTKDVEIKEAAEHLWHAFIANPIFRKRYETDPTFDSARTAINELVAQRPDPSKEYARRLAAMSATKGK